MGRQRSTRDDTEDLHGEIRRLRKLVDQQKREISRLQKFRNAAVGIDHSPDQAPPDSTPKLKKKDAMRCENCGSFDFATLTLNLRDGDRVLLTCKGCDARKVLK